jgi:hypothetical protein
MFSLGARWRDPEPPREPSAAERAGVTHPEAVARAVAALDNVMRGASGLPVKDWELLDRALDERQMVDPAPPLPDDYPALRPSAPFTPGGLG